MDPLTVLGLVSNIVQLIDAAASAFTVCHEIYKLGISIEDSRISYTSDQLDQSYLDLNKSLKNNNGPQVLKSGIDLTDLSLQCCETARALHVELESLRKSPSGGFRDTISKAILKKQKAKKIKRLKSRLDEYQKVLDSKILIDIRECLTVLDARQEGRNEKLVQQLSQLSLGLFSCHIPISNQIKLEIDKAITANDGQHAITRQHAETHIAAAVQDLKISQDQHRSEQKQEQHSQEQREQLLGSLTFDEINLRMNEVSLSHENTFEWMFDNGVKRPWDSFAAWLEGDEHVYWINGKAGSGKSTLMKFVASDPRTKSLLALWYPNTKALIVTYYFWLSGSKQQRTLGGMLCSIIRQIILSDKSLLEKLIFSDETLLTKRSIVDWSNNELRKLFRLLASLQSHPICIFIDGLDEFNPDEDVDNLLGLIEEFSMLSKVKLCVSSRPENYIVKRLSHYRQIRLQDLTVKDMRICVCDELERLRTKCPPASFNQKHFDEIVQIMIEKADGVFLWVYYALSSLTRGMRNEDNFEDLLDRIEELPSEMQKLYLQMWKRLNKDEHRYRDEATMYFSYDSFYPISLFEMLVALDKPLQDKYIKEVEPQDPVDIVRRCKILKTRIDTRCAGLLEVVDDRKNYDNPLTIFYETKIKYLHRTARDFLLTTKDGQDLISKPKELLDSRSKNVARAQMASLIQGLREFSVISIMNIIEKFPLSGQRNEIELLIDLRRFCEALSIPGSPENHIGYKEFWKSSLYVCQDFETLTAFCGCVKYIQHFVETKKSYISPYYCDFLFLCAANGTYRNPSGSLSLISWLGLWGVDVWTRHLTRYGEVFQPATTFLFQIMHRNMLKNDASAKQVIRIVQQLLPLLVDSVDTCPMQLFRKKDWSTAKPASIYAYGPRQSGSIIVYISAAKLCFLVMKYIEEHVSFKVHWSKPIFLKDDVTDVVFCVKESNYRWFLNREDSERLGKVLDNILFRDEASTTSVSSLNKDFELQLDRACQRSPKSSFGKWKRSAGWRIDKPTSIYGLDPTEDVDSSNWLERGHFRLDGNMPEYRLSAELRQAFNSNSGSGPAAGSIRSESEDEKVLEADNDEREHGEK